MIDGTLPSLEIKAAAEAITSKVNILKQKLLLLINKKDLMEDDKIYHIRNLMHIDYISAKNTEDVEDLKKNIGRMGRLPELDAQSVLVTNVRHYEALLHASESLQAVKVGLETNIPTDLVSQDLRQALHYLGSITGEITTDEVLGTIFSRFCIGK